MLNEQYKSWDYYREKAKNLWWFETVLLADAWKDKYNDFGKIQKYMCWFLQDRTKRRKFLSAFRLSFKTTVLNGFFCWMFCWYLARDYPMSMIYNTYTKDNAFDFSEYARFNLFENELLQWVFPELPKKERCDTLTKNRIQHKQIRMDFASVETTLVSRHYPIWLNDDLENDKNIRTEYMREELKKSWEYQKAILMSVEKKRLGLEVDVGTPFHYQGLIWQIRNNPTYDKLIIPYKDSQGNLTFPEFNTEGDFKKKQIDMRPSIFSAQFELKPTSDRDALCQEEWIRDRWDSLPKFAWRSMVIDPGGAEAGVNDATGITILDTDENGTSYVAYAEEHWFKGPNELIDMIVTLKKDYEPDDTRIEKERYSNTIADIMKHRFPLMNIAFVEHKRVDKETRIWRLRQPFAQKRIILGKNQRALESQLRQWQGDGTIKFDDLLDSLAYNHEIRRIPKKARPHTLPSGREFNPKSSEAFDREFETFMEGINREKEVSGDDALY